MSSILAHPLFVILDFRKVPPGFSLVPLNETGEPVPAYREYRDEHCSPLFPSRNLPRFSSSHSHSFAARRYRMVLCSVTALLYIICKLIMAENKERTFIMVKPDGVQRGLVGKIIQRFEDKGFKLVGMKMLWVSASLRTWTLPYYVATRAMRKMRYVLLYKIKIFGNTITLILCKQFVRFYFLSTSIFYIL